MARLKDICFDCSHAASLASWWAQTLEYVVRPYTDQDLRMLLDAGYSGPDEDPSVAVDDPNGTGPTIWFNTVPEPKTTKNRLHLDVLGDVDALLARGATVITTTQRWTVMADPEGNEFCVFPES